MSASSDPQLPAHGDPPAPRSMSARKSRNNRRTYGNVRKRASNRWQARYTGPDGERRPIGTFETEKAANVALARVLSDVYQGTYREPETGDVPLREYARRWLATRDLRPSTRSGYEGLLDRWILAPLDSPGAARKLDLGSLPLRSLSHTMVSEWYAAVREATAASAAKWLSRGSGPSDAAHVRAWAGQAGHPVKKSGRMPAALWEAWRADGAPAAAANESRRDEAVTGRTQAARAYALLRTICGDAVRDQLIEANPCRIRGAGQTRPAERVVPGDSVVDAILAAFAGPSERYRAAVVVAAHSGLRAGELFALERQHVERTASGGVRLNVRQSLVEVTGKPVTFGPPKSDAGRRKVHLPPDAAQELLAHLDRYTAPGPRALVFATKTGKPVRGGQRTSMFTRAKRRAGAPSEIRWHDLRHLAATRAAEAGATLAELQRRIGHSTVAAAMVYQHATDDGDARLAARMAEIQTARRAPNVLQFPA
jgi:integrase